MAENAAVSNLSIFYMVITFIIQFILPISITIYLYRKEKITPKPMVVGVISFTIIHIVIRILLDQGLQSASWYKNLAKSNLFLATLIIVSLVGILEEVARVKGFTLFLKNQWEWKDGIALGLGFGGMESVFSGLDTAKRIIISLAINYKAFANIKVAASMKKLLITTTPSLLLAAGLESLFILCIQIGLTLLALYGIRIDKHKYSMYAVVIHVLVHLPLPFLNKIIGVWSTEALLALIAAIALVLSYKAKEWYELSSLSYSNAYRGSH